ncbi:MAG: hypothetical protein AB7V39_27225 [Nitrospiraceae bacterium]
MFSVHQVQVLEKMTLTSFIDRVYSFDDPESAKPVSSFFKDYVGSLMPEDRPLAASHVIRLLARTNWREALFIAPLALQESKQSQDDTVSIVESLVLFAPSGEEFPEFLVQAIDSMIGGDLAQIANAAKSAYRAKCLQLLILARSGAPASNLVDLLSQIERAAQVFNPVNEVVISAVNAMSSDDELLQPFSGFLQKLVDLTKIEGKEETVKLSRLLKVFDDWDVSKYSGPI